MTDTIARGIAARAQGYAPKPMRTAIFSQAKMTTAPAAVAGMTREDIIYLNDLTYTASDVSGIGVPGVRTDIDKMQQFIIDCYVIARNLKNNDFDNLITRQFVRASFPRGMYYGGSPLCMLPYVSLDHHGQYIRAFPSGSAPTTYTGDTASNACSNPFQPAIILPPTGMIERVQLYCNPDGIAGHRGSGIAIGKLWTVASATIAAAGGGYKVGDVLIGANADRSPYLPFKITVTQVGGSGEVQAITVSDMGAYSMPIEIQKRAWKSANGFPNVFDASGRHVLTPDAGVTGVGCSVTVTWHDDFIGTGGNYRTSRTVVGNSLIERSMSTGVGENQDSVFGTQFNWLYMGLNHVAGELQCTGGYHGVLASLANDIRIESLNPVLCKTGLTLGTVGSFQCPNFVADSCIDASLRIDKCRNVKIDGNVFFATANAKGAAAQGGGQAGGQLIAGRGGGTDYNVDCDVRLRFHQAGPNNTAGAPQVAVLQYSRDCYFELGVANGTETEQKRSNFVVNGVAQIGPGFEASNTIAGTISGATGPLFNGAGLAAGATAPDCDVRVWDAAASGWCEWGGLYDIRGRGAPTAATGQNKAAKGSVFRDAANGEEYINAGSATSPAWKLVAKAA